MVMSVVGAFYYLRIIKIMYFEDADEALDEDIPIANKIVLGISILVISAILLSGLATFGLGQYCRKYAYGAV